MLIDHMIMSQLYFSFVEVSMNCVSFEYISFIILLYPAYLTCHLVAPVGLGLVITQTMSDGLAIYIYIYISEVNQNIKKAPFVLYCSSVRILPTLYWEYSSCQSVSTHATSLHGKGASPRAET